MLDVYTTSIIVFFGILGVIIFLDRKNIEFKYVLLIRRTKKGLEILDKIAGLKKFWKIIGIVAIITCFFLIIYGLVTFIEASRLIIAGRIKEPQGGLVFFSPSSETIIGTGYILIPFWFWIIIIPTILFPHEIAHGIMSRVEKIKIKSAGLLLLLIIPGAFVEPDEKGIKKTKLLGKLRIFAAGSFANIIFAFFLFNPFLGIGLIPNVIWPGLVPGQTQIEVLLINVTEGGPAAQAGLKNGTIMEINKTPIEIDYFDYIDYISGYGRYITKYIQDVKVGDKIEIVVNNTSYTVTVGETVTEKNITMPYLGIVTTLKAKGNISLFNFLTELFFWMWNLSFAVAVFNILPIYPLDGGLMLQAVTEKITKKYYKEIVTVATILTISLVLFIIFGPSIIAELRSF